MKKTALFPLIALLLAASVCPAQRQNSFKFGLHASPFVKWLNSTTYGWTGDGAKIGFSYGLNAEFFFGERYSFCTGIDFSYRGGTLKYTNPLVPVNLNLNLQYVEIPVTIKMHTKQIGPVTYFAKFGFSPGINTSATITDAAGNDISIKDDIRIYYAALKIGLGTEYEISDQTMLYAGINWNNGLINIFKTGTINLLEANPLFTTYKLTKSLKANNNAVELELGVLF